MVDYVVRTIKADDDHPDVELVCNNEEFVTLKKINKGVKLLERLHLLVKFSEIIKDVSPQVQGQGDREAGL